MKHRLGRPMFAYAGLVVLACCTPKRDAPRRCLKDAVSGELPVVAMWASASTHQLLAVWPNGDVVWQGGLVRSGEEKSGALSTAALDELLADLESSLATYEDTPEEAASAPGPSLGL